MKLAGQREHIVIVGAGYAGLSCALSLARKAPQARISIVNREGRQELTSELFRSLRTGKAEYFDFRSLLRQHDIRFVEGHVLAIDPHTQQLRFKHGTPALNYDTLVLATGQKTEIPPIPGLADFLGGDRGVDNKVFLFKTNAQAQSLRMALRRLHWCPDPAALSRDTFVVILGGGTAGLEVAGEIAAMRARNRRARVVLLEQNRDLLPDFSPIAQKKLKQILARMGIETLLGSAAIRVDDREIHIQNGQVIPWDLLVLCAGGRPPAQLFNPFAKTFDLRQGLLVNNRCEIPGFPAHYAIGDIARIPEGENPLHNYAPVPKRAQFAVQEGRYLAQELSHKLKHQNLSGNIETFCAQDLGYLVSLGPNEGLARFGAPVTGFGWRLASPFVTGPLVDRLKQLAKLKYLTQLSSRWL